MMLLLLRLGGKQFGGAEDEGLSLFDLPFPGLTVCVHSIRLSSHQRIFLVCLSLKESSRLTPTAAASRSPNLAPGRRAMPLY